MRQVKADQFETFKIATMLKSTEQDIELLRMDLEPISRLGVDRLFSDVEEAMALALRERSLASPQRQTKSEGGAGGEKDQNKITPIPPP